MPSFISRQSWWWLVSCAKQNSVFLNPGKEVTHDTGIEFIPVTLDKGLVLNLANQVSLNKALVLNLANQVTHKHNFVVQILKYGLSFKLRLVILARNFWNEFDRDVKVVVWLNEYLKSNKIKNTVTGGAP